MTPDQIKSWLNDRILKSHGTVAQEILDYIIELEANPILRSDSKYCGKGFCEANAFRIEIRRLKSLINKDL